jgi:Mg2+/Co2+ transporter CorB
MIIGLLLIFIPFLLLEAFFSGSEIALISASRRRLRHWAEQGDRGAARALKLLERPERLLATTLLGSNLSEISNTILVTAFLLETLGLCRNGHAPPAALILIWRRLPPTIGRQHPTVWPGLAHSLVVSGSLSLTFIFAGGSRGVPG